MPVADEPPRVRVHVLPFGEGLKGRGVGVVTRPEVRHQHPDPAKAAGAEPVFFERPTRGRLPPPRPGSGPSQRARSRPRGCT